MFRRIGEDTESACGNAATPVADVVRPSSRPHLRVAQRGWVCSALLENRVPDALGNVDQMLTGTRKAPVELAAGGDLVDIVDADQR